MSHVTSGTVSPVGGSAAAEKIVTVAGFAGIDKRICPGGEPSGSGPSAVADVRNFRVLPGGALEKRKGFRCLATLAGQIRAAVPLLYNGEEHLICATANGVYDYSEDLGIRRITSMSPAGDCTYFYRAASGLSLFMNGQTFRVAVNRISASAYLPTYLKDHESTLPCLATDVYEDFNLLTRYVRMTFAFKTDTDLICLPFQPKSVRTLKVNGQKWTGTYTFETLNGYLFMRLSAEVAKGGTAELICAAPDSVFGEDDHPLSQAGSAFFFKTSGLEGQQYLILAMPDGGCRWSNPIPDDGVGSVYFPKANYFDPVPDGYPITGFTRHFDRILCFTENATYQLLRLDPSPRFRFCNSSIGCVSPNATAIVENAPVTISDGNLCRFTDNSEESDLDDAAPVSGAIGDLGLAGGACLFFDRIRHELWIRDMTSSEGLVHIYNVQTNAWYIFSGIPANGFFLFDRQVGYFGGKSLYLTDDTRSTDEDTNGDDVPIHALAETHWMGFGAGNPVRRSGTLALTCLTGGGKFTLEVLTDSGADCKATVSRDTPSAPEAPAILEYGFNPGRFRFFKIRITSDSTEHIGLYRLCVAGRK